MPPISPRIPSTDEPLDLRPVEEELDLQPVDDEPLDIAPLTEEEPSLVNRIFDKASTPLTDAPSRLTRFLTSLPESDLAYQKMNELLPGLGTAASTVRGFQEGSLEAIGDLLSGLTSPLNLALTATGLGTGAAAKAGLQGTARALNVGTKALSAPVAAQGISHIAEAESPVDVGLGVAETAGGLAGLGSKVPKPTTKAPLPSGKPKVRLNPDGTYSPLDAPHLKFDSKGNQIKTPIDKLLGALDDAVNLNKEQAEIYRAERAEKFKKAESIKTPGVTGHYQRMGQLAGEHTKVSTAPLKLDQADLDSLMNSIRDNRRLTLPEQIRAGEGLIKIVEGKVPQNNEIILLREVFGPQVMDMIRAKLPKIDLGYDIILDTVNIPRAIQTAYDISMPLRQGLPLIHTKAWWKSWNGMVRSFGSESAYRGIIDEILDRPNFKRMVDADGKVKPSFAEDTGLKITDLTELAKREESAQSTIAERIFPGIRASNRAATAFLDRVRADVFDSMVRDAETIYQSAKTSGYQRRFLGLHKERLSPQEIEALNPRTNIVLAKQIADYINNATGRGSLKVNVPKYGEANFERYAPALNAIFFSPRLMKSRLHFLNPSNYIFQPKQVRQAHLKSMLALGSFWFTMANLGKMMGGEVSLDTNNADFGKIRMGDVRLDPAAGFQQYLVLMSRMASGAYTSSVSDKEYELGMGFKPETRASIAGRFVTQKFTPPLAFAYGMLNASEHQPFNVGDKTVQLFIPMVAQDAIEIAKENPALLPFLLPLSATGMGTQQYGDRPETFIIPEELDVSLPLRD